MEAGTLRLVGFRSDSFNLSVQMQRWENEVQYWIWGLNNS